MTLLEDIKNKLPKNMYIPKEFILLFEWMEEKSFIKEENGQLKGYLLDSTKEENKGIYFSSENRDIWHFKQNEQAKDRFSPIAYIDKEDNSGCMGLWLDGQKKQHIVWVGYEFSTPMPFCILKEPLSLLKLLSIGYSDIFYWNEYYEQGINIPVEEEDRLNISLYQEWVQKAFNIVIPSTAQEVVPHFSSINDESSTDIFLRWDREQNGLWHYYRYTKMLYDKINLYFPEIYLEREGFYSRINDGSLYTEVMFWLESDDVDITDIEIIESVKKFSTWVMSVEQDINDDSYRTHIWTEFVVSFLEELYCDRKLHHLITHICSKDEILNNKEFITGYMSASEEDYLHVLSLFDT